MPHTLRITAPHLTTPLGTKNLHNNLTMSDPLMATSSLMRNLSTHRRLLTTPRYRSTIISQLNKDSRPALIKVINTRTVRLPTPFNTIGKLLYHHTKLRFVHLQSLRTLFADRANRSHQYPLGMPMDQRKAQDTQCL